LRNTSLKPEFETFVFASIGEDGNGTPLSVLSGLARLNLDPWLEAAELGRLPGKAALERLTSLIQALSGDARALPDPQAVAARLLGLLPGPQAGRAETGEGPAGLGAIMKSRPWLVYVLLIGFALGSQIMIASQRVPTAEDQAATNSGAKTIPPRPPVESGRSFPSK
jgi:hypothetical protein